MRRGHLISVAISRTFAALISAGALVSTPACGYRLSGQATGLPETIRTIAIPVFENDSFEPNIEGDVTQAVTQKFINDGRLRVVPPGEADAVLTGTVQKYQLEAVAWDEFNFASQYNLTLSVKMVFEDKTGKDIRREYDVSGATSYILGVSIVGAESARQQAVIDASGVIGDNIVGLLLEGF